LTHRPDPGWKRNPAWPSQTQPPLPEEASNSRTAPASPPMAGERTREGPPASRSERGVGRLPLLEGPTQRRTGLLDGVLGSVQHADHAEEAVDHARVPADRHRDARRAQAVSVGLALVAQ